MSEQDAFVDILQKALDALEGKISVQQAKPFIDELENVSHRESTTGFYYNKADADKTTIGASDSKYQLAAQIGDEVKGQTFDDLYNESQKRYKDFDCYRGRQGQNYICRRVSYSV